MLHNIKNEMSLSKAELKIKENIIYSRVSDFPTRPLHSVPISHRLCYCNWTQCQHNCSIYT